MIFTNEDIEYCEYLKDALARGFSVNGKKITELYNRILNKNIPPTSCGSCLRNRAKVILQEYDKFLEELKKQEEHTEEIIPPKKRGRKAKTTTD